MSASRSVHAVRLERRALNALNDLVRDTLRNMPSDRQATRSLLIASRALRRACALVSNPPLGEGPMLETMNAQSGTGLRAYRDVRGRIVLQQLTRQGSTWVPDMLPLWVIAPEEQHVLAQLVAHLAPPTRRRTRGRKRSCVH